MLKPVRRALTALLLLGFMARPSMVVAYNQPALNLSATTFLDGGAPQGLYYINYFIFINGRSALDNNGEVIPGDARVNVAAQLNQFYWLTPINLLGGQLGLDVIFPVVSPSARGLVGPNPLPTNTAGMGDFVAGVALQWDKGTLLGGPVFQRVESNVTFPTGKYDKNQAINPGANLLTVDSYYSWVWLFHPRWETSWRAWYTFHGENDDHAFGKVAPGNAFHVNYAASYAILPKWRVGAAGYYLQQTTEDEINGLKQTNSKERAIAFGPGLVYMGQGLTLMLSHPVEFSVRNRFKGSRTTLQMIHKF